MLDDLIYEEEDYEDDSIIPDPCDYYEKSYGPSNPWDAPGMCVSDFVPGVLTF